MPYSLIIDLVGHTVLPEEKALLQHPRVSGVLLFLRNIAHRTQLCQLTHAIHSIRPDIMIMIDHEGGNVQRIQRQGFRDLMSARSHGDIFQADAGTGLRIARKYGELMARDLLACGIDLSLAPVLDLHDDDSTIIGQLDRAFGTNPDNVTQLAAAYIEGMHAAQMPAVGKHFPGHGSCTGDSHRELPVNDKSWDELASSDLKPFIDLIKLNKLDGVMPAHVLYPAVDANHATGYSNHWLHDILRHKLQFDGLVVSDCLGMTGADIGDLKTRAECAITAGCDVLIVANQSRDTLTQLLNDLKPMEDSNPESSVRLKAFQSNMHRFQSGNPKPASYTLSQEHRHTEPCIDLRNPTQSV